MTHTRAVQRAARRTLVVAASSPLGLAFVRQALVRGDKVYAACRSPARVGALAELRGEFAGLDLVALDPADAASVADAIPVLEGLSDTIDLVVIAPAEHGPHERPSDQVRDDALPTMSGIGMVEHYRRHAVAPVLLVRTLLPWLAQEEGARVLVVDSGARADGYASSASAAALHALVRALAADLSEQRITVCVGYSGPASPGGDAAEGPIPLDEAAAGLLDVVERLSHDRTGCHVDWTGSERAW